MIVKILEKIKILNNRSKLFASVIVAVLVISLLVFQTISIIELNSSINEEETLLASDRLRLTHIQTIEKNYSKSSEKLDSLEASIPSSPMEESILTSMQQTSEEALTDFTKISFGKTTLGDGLNQISLTVSFSGSFYSLLDLLDKIKKGSRLVKFESLNISKEKGKNNLKAEIQALSFYSLSGNETSTDLKK